MRLWKVAPMRWVGLALIALAVELLLTAVPDAGPLLREIISPLFASGMVYAATTSDRGEPPSLLLALRAFTEPAAAIAAVVGANLVAFSGQAFAAWWIAGNNLLSNAPDGPELSGPAMAGTIGIGVLAALPVAFVPFHVLLERVRPGAAFAASWNAFVVNTLPLLVYAAASLVLIAIGVATAGFGLLIALPLLATSGYAAWKDVFSVGNTG